MAKKDSDYKGKLLRLFREIMLLHQSPFGMKINDLAEKLGVTYRTIYRDFELLEEVGFIPEEIEPKKYVLSGFDRDMKKFEKNLNFTMEEAGLLSKAVLNIPKNHPLRNEILGKLLSFSGMEDVMKSLIKTDRSRMIGDLSRAMREKKQLELKDYRSANSSSVKTRKVEPYSFSRDGVFVKCFEIESGENKTFKIERIGSVRILDSDWENEANHESEKEEDIFGITGGESNSVKLKMSMRAAQLLQEEFPLSRKYIHKEDVKHFLFEAKVNGFSAVSRFVLGLIDEVEVLSPKALKSFLRKKLQDKKI